MGTGPHKPIEGLDAYLRAERDGRRRIGPDGDTYAAASLLLGACAQRAFAYDLTAVHRPPQPLDEFAAGLTRTLLRGVAAPGDTR